MKNKILKKLKKDDNQVAFSIRLPLTLKTDLQTFANKNSVSANSLITLVLEEFMYGNFSSNEKKIIELLTAFNNLLQEEFNNIHDNNLEDDIDPEIYQGMKDRKEQLNILLEELN